MKYDKYTVECIEDSINLDKGQRYEVYQEDDNNYWIKENKWGASSFYPKAWFKKLEGVKLMKEYSFEEVIANIKEGETYTCTDTLYGLQTITKDDIGFKFNKELSICSSGINNMQRFVKVEKPVSFNDVLNSDSKCKIEHWRIADLISDKDDGQNFLWLQEYQNLDDIIHAIGEEFNTIAVKEILKDAKWYLEE